MEDDEYIIDLKNQTNEKGEYTRKIDIIRCGNCIGCKLDKAAEWGTRCFLESLKYKNNYFVTLTYDQEHLLFDNKIDTITGEVLGQADLPTIYKKELQDFNKRLRSDWKRHHNHEGIRFYAAGEYGTKNGRPHYHSIYFNLPLYDLTDENFHGFNEWNEPMWRSPELEKIWGKGMVVVGFMTWNSAAYVARYTTKKIFKSVNDEEYIKQGLTPEFTLMSRKPGIAMNYFEENKELLLETNKVLIKKHDNTTATRALPRIFKEKIKKSVTEDEWIQISEKQKQLAKQMQRIKQSKTSLSKTEQLALEERTKLEQLLQLKREKI